MSRLQTSFILAFHGRDQQVGEQALSGRTELLQSDRDHDWLGPGIYFWEGDPRRAMEWAVSRAARRIGMVPLVIGAVIDLGNCLDLTGRDNIELLREAHAGLVATHNAEDRPLPQNRDAAFDRSRDRLIRELDCAVIRYLHSSIEAGGGEPFDTVRGMFQEGEPIYGGSGFRERTHTQVAVRSEGCIKGLFLPRR